MIQSGKFPHQPNLSSKLLPNAVFSHSRFKQVAYKHASEILFSNLNKVKNSVFEKYKRAYKKCIKGNIHKRFTQRHFKDLNINYLKRIKVNLKNINIVLDYRFFDVQDTSGEFNEFVRVFLPWFKEGKKRAETLNLPLKYHKHSLKLKSEGFKRKQAIQLELRDNKFFLNLIWEKEEPQKKENSFKVGIDQGFHKLISDSNGIHWGIELQEIYKRLSKKKRGSKKYKRLLTFKKQKINQTVNRFIKAYPDTDIVCQNLKDVKKVSKLYRSVNNRLQYWSYRQVLDKLENLSSLEGFKVIKVNPAYTSQTCSKCGTVIKSNRQGQIYRCSCGLLIDADTNAAVNILHRGVYSLSQQNPCFH